MFAHSVQVDKKTLQILNKIKKEMKATSQVVELDFELAVTAGKTALEIRKKAKDWGLADSIILCTARSIKGKVITGDEHCRNLEEVIFIK